MRVKYVDYSSNEVEDLGRIGDPTGVFDFETGEEILIGDIIEVKYLVCNSGNLLLRPIQISSLTFMCKEKTGKPYVFGFKSQEYFSSDKFTENFKKNVIEVLSNISGPGVSVLLKSKQGNIKELNLNEIPSYISFSHEED